MTAEPSSIARRRAAARDEANPSYVQRRREIIAAAAQVFKAKGLQGANLGDIARESGGDRASLYYYVGNKQELFQEVVREAVEHNLAAAQNIRGGEGPAAPKLRMLIEQLMISYSDNYPILYVFLQENLSHVPDKHAGWAKDMQRLNREYIQVIIDLVATGMAEGSIRRLGEPWVVAYGLMGMLGWTSRWFNPSSAKASAAEIGRTFADTLLLGLQQGGSGRRRRTG